VSSATINHLNNYIVNRFDFKSLSKAKFDFVTRKYKIDHWRSSDDNKTPGQIKYISQI